MAPLLYQIKHIYKDSEGTVVTFLDTSIVLQLLIQKAINSQYTPASSTPSIYKSGKDVIHPHTNKTLHFFIHLFEELASFNNAEVNIMVLNNSRLKKQVFAVYRKPCDYKTSSRDLQTCYMNQLSRVDAELIQMELCWKTQVWIWRQVRAVLPPATTKQYLPGVKELKKNNGFDRDRWGK